MRLYALGLGQIKMKKHMKIDMKKTIIMTITALVFIISFLFIGLAEKLNSW